MRTLTLIMVLILFTVTVHSQTTVRYDLHVTDTTVNFTGKARKAIAINGQLPAPTLYFREGDTAEVHVHNHIHHETSIHWHGLLLPNEQDGVPYLTTAPIKSHSTHTYRFVIRQTGTYWYHSHTMLQEQIGMYGAIVIYGKNEQPRNEEVLLLSDWSDENPHQIERSLHYATDWYMLKKNAVQSYGEAIAEGYGKTKLINEWKRMHAMDVSDVYYEKFLVNGKPEQSNLSYRAGDKIRLRVINGSSSTYFWLNYAGGKITVVASDGMPVEPVEVDRLIVGVSEIYDVEVTIPDENRSYEFLATAEDRTGSASYWLGNGEKVSHDALPRLRYFEGMKMMNDMMTVAGNMKDMGMNMSLQQMDMNEVMYPEFDQMESHNHQHGHPSSGNLPVTLNYNMLKAPSPTTLPPGPVTTYHFELTGNMNRYVWTVNSKTISESDKIMIRKGENIRMIITNNSMMRHPMHLHGHFFRILNDHGEYSPLKNVLDIMPMETDTIEFHAGEEYGDWFFHCHILYHMMSGMGRIFSYENSPPNPQITDPVKALRKVYHDDRRFYLGSEILLTHVGSEGEVSYMNTRWRIDAEWRLGFDKESGHEVETHIGRYIGKNQFLFAYTGWDWRSREEEHDDRNWFDQHATSDSRSVWCFGVQYKLPLLVVADLRADHTGNLRMQFSREDIPVTKRLRLEAMYNSDNEFGIGAKYIITKYFAGAAHYDSDLGFGAGLMFTY